MPATRIDAGSYRVRWKQHEADSWKSAGTMNFGRDHEWVLRVGPSGPKLLDLEKVRVGDRADGVLADRFENILNGDLTTPIGAGKDRAAIDEDGRHVEADHGHHHAWQRLVAARQTDEVPRPVHPRPAEPRHSRFLAAMSGRGPIDTPK